MQAMGSLGLLVRPPLDLNRLRSRLRLWSGPAWAWDAFVGWIRQLVVVVVVVVGGASQWCSKLAGESLGHRDSGLN